jgi:CHRD domain
MVPPNNRHLGASISALNCKSTGEVSLQLRGGEEMRYIALVTLAAALMLSAPAARAIPIPFGGILSGANEAPPNGSPATGSVTVVLDPTAQTIQILASFFGLTTNDTAAHIHCCQMTLGTPPTVMVATTMPTFNGFPLGVTQGVFSGLFSLQDPTFYNPAFVTAEGGTIAGAENALIEAIENGLTYFNIHTTQFPGGEIRTQLLPLGVAVPGPIVGTGLPGLILACGVLLALARRRRQIAC